METKINQTRNSPSSSSHSSRRASGFPTETVYGLGADALNEAAVKKVYQVKGRPSDNPLIVHVNNVEMVKIRGDLTRSRYKIGVCLWPGPLTLILMCLAIHFLKQ